MINSAYLAHGILLHVILETTQLQVQHGGESLKYDPLLGVLQSVSFSHVLVLSLESLDLHIVLERIM